MNGAELWRGRMCESATETQHPVHREVVSCARVVRQVWPSTDREEGKTLTYQPQLIKLGHAWMHQHVAYRVTAIEDIVVYQDRILK